jgi:hypothetical protein
MSLVHGFGSADSEYALNGARTAARQRECVSYIIGSYGSVIPAPAHRFTYAGIWCDTIRRTVNPAVAAWRIGTIREALRKSPKSRTVNPELADAPGCDTLPA